MEDTWISVWPELLAIVLGSVVYVTVLVLMVHLRENPWRLRFGSYARSGTYWPRLALAAALHALVAGTLAFVLPRGYALLAASQVPTPMSRFVGTFVVLEGITYLSIRYAKITEAWGYLGVSATRFSSLVTDLMIRNLAEGLSDFAGRKLNEVEDDTSFAAAIDGLFDDNADAIKQAAVRRASLDPRRADSVGRIRDRRQKLDHLVLLLGYDRLVARLRKATQPHSSTKPERMPASSQTPALAGCSTVPVSAEVRCVPPATASGSVAEQAPSPHVADPVGPHDVMPDAGAEVHVRQSPQPSLRVDHADRGVATKRDVPDAGPRPAVENTDRVEDRGAPRQS